MPKERHVDALLKKLVMTQTDNAQLYETAFEREREPISA